MSTNKASIKEEEWPLIEGFHLQVGDRVMHIKDETWIGKVIYIDWNLIHLGYGVTTCVVSWDDWPEDTQGDRQFTNKLIRLGS
jgi:hypothetical protein